ncbi:hypothetical protein K2173_017664 [Erythroxylum novogranatense]|uniref:Major facilitator superfamily (MFS) profile domain-containing protein n=1 Tax=Erythroxylum novogranatense TaxID=1862640 RepID=A0AAV8T1P1_9ROSI|nr:hypothetical protein K2173_017664 [Erythroxylum novogranatense]
MAGEDMEEGLISSKSSATTTTVMVNESPSAAASSVTPMVVFSTMVAVCGSLGNGCATAYSSPAESGIIKDVGLSVAAYSLFASSLTIGGVVGSLINGKMADLFGRRYTMWIAEAFCLMGWLAIAFGKAAWLLDVGRLSTGIGLGIIFFFVPTYIAEITPEKFRGGFTACNELMICSGFSMAYFVGTMVSWRTLALIGAIPCTLHAIGVFFIPESPRWLAKLSREEEVLATLRSLRGKNAAIFEEAANITDFTEAFRGQPADGKLWDMFHPRYARILLVGIGIMLFPQIGGTSAVAYYAQSIFEKADFSSDFGQKSLAIVEIPFATASVLLTDKVGRRPLLLISASGMCLSCFIAGLAFCIQGHHLAKEITPVLVYFGILGYCVFNTIGMAGLPCVIMSEIFPINIKGRAGSLVSLISWTLSWTVAFTFNFMMEWSSAGTFLIFCLVWGSAVLFIFKLIPETKGRSLEELQASFTNVI